MDDRRAGAALRALRRRRGLRQVDVAGDAGVDRTTVSRIGRGHLDTPTVRRLRLVHAAVDARFIRLSWRGGDLDRCSTSVTLREPAEGPLAGPGVPPGDMPGPAPALMTPVAHHCALGD
jgi:transcriptional regulator with XRE-family HTH domain